MPLKQQTTPTDGTGVAAADLRRARRPYLWMIQLGLGLGFIAAYSTIVPAELLDPIYVLIGLYATVCVLVGVRLWHPEYPLAWHLLALGVVAYLVGDAIFIMLTAITGSEPPVPSVADAFYYLLYPLLGVSVFLTVRRQQPGRDRAAAIDAALATVAATVLTWTFLMAPYASDDSLSALQKAASLGYPLGDLLLVALLARLVLISGRHPPAFTLLVGALVMNLVADITYLYQTLADNYEPGSPTDIGWLLAYVLFGTAALHPSMREYGKRSTAVLPSRPARQRRLAAMAFAALSAPVLIVLRVLHGDYSEVGVIALGCVAMFVLVLVRLGGLLSEVEFQHGQLQAAFGDLQQAQSERRMLLDQTVRAREQERTVLAANLHDGPIQRLTAVSLTLDRALMRLDRDDAALASELLERGQGQLRDEVDALRRMMSELRPPILDQAGFEAGVRDLMEDFARRTGVTGRVTGCLLAPLDAETETALYRVAQEALWNVAKHARATRVEIELSDDGTDVALAVVDDGVGFHPVPLRSLVRDGHFGLMGMRERLESAGGVLLVESVPRVGTRLTARVPRVNVDNLDPAAVPPPARATAMVQTLAPVPVGGAA